MRVAVHQRGQLHLATSNHNAERKQNILEFIYSRVFEVIDNKRGELYLATSHHTAENNILEKERQKELI
jgi:hypothetical protein